MGTRVKLKLPLRARSLIVRRLSQEDRVDEAGDFGMRQLQSDLALLADDLHTGVVLVCIGVDAAGFADGQLGHLLDTFFSVSFRWLRDHLDVDEDGVFLRRGVLLVMSLLAIGTEANIAVHAEVEALLVFLSQQKAGGVRR